MRDNLIQHLPFFTDEQRALVESVRRFVASDIEPNARHEDDGDVQSKLLLTLLAEAGLLRYAVAGPGGALDVRALCLLREALSYSSAQADLAFVMQGLGTYALSLAAPDHVRDFWLARAVNGQSIAAFALTEETAGSDVSAISTRAVLADGNYILNGTKKFISNAGIADFYTVFARTGTRPDGRSELSAFVISARLQGFSVVERTRMLAAHPIGVIKFDNCIIPAEDMVGEVGDGFVLAMQTMNMFRASVGAAACGMAWRALDEALAFARARQQFGKPLVEFQMIQAKLAEMVTELDAARLLVYSAAYMKDAGIESTTRAVSEAKLFATETAQRIIDQALQIHGGAGLVQGCVIERLYRDIRALRIYEGTSEIQKLIIANQLLQDA